MKERLCKNCKYYLPLSGICTNPNADEAATHVKEDHRCHIFETSSEEKEIFFVEK